MRFLLFNILKIFTVFKEKKKKWGEGRNLPFLLFRIFTLSHRHTYAQNKPNENNKTKKIMKFPSHIYPFLVLNI